MRLSGSVAYQSHPHEASAGSEPVSLPGGPTRRCLPRLDSRLRDRPGPVGQELWEYAQEEGLAIVTKDADFSELSTLYGPPPVVIWIRRGNCSSKDIERVLRRHQDALEEMAANSPAGIVELY